MISFISLMLIACMVDLALVCASIDYMQVWYDDNLSLIVSTSFIPFLIINIIDNMTILII